MKIELTEQEWRDLYGYLIDAKIYYNGLASRSIDLGSDEMYEGYKKDEAYIDSLYSKVRKQVYQQTHK